MERGAYRRDSVVLFSKDKPPYFHSHLHKAINLLIGSKKLE